MKTTSITKAILAAALAIAALPVQAANRTLVLLQENSGRSSITAGLPAGVRTLVDRVVDLVAESAEAAKFEALASRHYQRFVNLSDTDCTRQNLLNTLISRTDAGSTVDLVVLGHGAPNFLALHNDSLTGRVGANPGSIRTMLSEARTRKNNPQYKFKLRLVYMCNCDGSTLNDDWLNIGAESSVGSLLDDNMPEPMLTFFWDDFVKNDKAVTVAATDAFSATRPFYSIFPEYNRGNPSLIQQSRLIVAGNQNLIFHDEMQLKLNEERSFTVRANAINNFPSIHTSPGKNHKLTSSTSDTWLGGAFAAECNANGVNPGPFDALRRAGFAKQMALCGELHRHNESDFIGGTMFSVGTNKTHTGPSGKAGFYNFFANDVLAGYGDNEGSIRVTIKRTR